MVSPISKLSFNVVVPPSCCRCNFHSFFMTLFTGRGRHHSSSRGGGEGRGGQCCHVEQFRLQPSWGISLWPSSLLWTSLSFVSPFTLQLSRITCCHGSRVFFSERPCGVTVRPQWRRQPVYHPLAPLFPKVTSALRVTGGSVVVVECIRVAQFTRRRFSIAQRVTPSLSVDDVDRCTPDLQMEPEDMHIRPQNQYLGS